MASRYPIKRLVDVGVKVYDCEHKTPKAQEQGFPYIAIPNIVDGRIDLTDVRLISHDDYLEWTRRSKPQSGDIVVTRRARVGDTAVIPKGLECAIGQNLVLLRSEGNEILQDYLRWAVRGTEYFNEVARFLNVGAVFDSLNVSDIPKFELPIPPLSEQRAIAEILGSLDDKIEANRRMNETLEATARAIFKSWFVDFDPVHAKARGETPSGMDAETAALFPDSFEDSELGPIPSGWRIMPIGDAVKVVGGSTPSTAETRYWDGGIINWATPKDLSKLSSPVLLDTERRITDEGLKQISSGLLPQGTLLLSSRAPVGYLAVAEIPVAINQGFIAMICDNRIPTLYALYWTENNLDIIKSRASGTTFQEISKANFRPIPALVPTDEILQTYTELVEPIYKTIVCNLEETGTLAETRDALLPKLVSGEVRVGKHEV